MFRLLRFLLTRPPSTSIHARFRFFVTSMSRNRCLSAEHKENLNLLRNDSLLIYLYHLPNLKSPALYIGRGIISWYHLISQTTHIACLTEYSQNNIQYHNMCYSIILSCCNVHSTSRPTRHIHSAAKLQDVFIKNFPRASHQPAALCAFHSLLLVLIIAFIILLLIIYMNPSALSTTNSLFQPLSTICRVFNTCFPKSI